MYVDEIWGLYRAYFQWLATKYLLYSPDFAHSPSLCDAVWHNAHRSCPPYKHSLCLPG
jgi:hypothetical protein